MRLSTCVPNFWIIFKGIVRTITCIKKYIWCQSLIALSRTNTYYHFIKKWCKTARGQDNLLIYSLLYRYISIKKKVMGSSQGQVLPVLYFWHGFLKCLNMRSLIPLYCIAKIRAKHERKLGYSQIVVDNTR